MPRQRSPLLLLALALLPLAALCGLVRSLLPLDERGPRPHAPASAGASSTGAPALDAAQRAKIEETYGRLPLSFEANEGQVAGGSDVRFVSRGQGYALFLTPTGAVLALNRGANRRESVDEGRAGRSHAAGNHGARASASAPVVLRMSLVGANAEPSVRGAAELPGKSNYFIGDDPSKWRADVAHFAAVEYAEVYPGVDLVYYGNQRQLEYDFRLAPGADPRRIALKFDGAERVDLDAAGELVLHTPGGEVRQHKPFAYQETEEGNRREVASAYRLLGTREGIVEVGFEVGAYDAARPLVIDPTLVYSTYLGGTGADSAHAVAVDSAGNVYLAGRTLSTNFPTQSPVQGASAGGADEGFVTKINAAGSALVYSTYLGGTGADGLDGIAVDDFGAAYVTGLTSSTDYPLQAALQPAYGGGSADVVLTKLNPAGNALVYSTYLGGSGGEEASDIAVDANRDVYLAGNTDSNNFPTTGAFQPSLSGTLDAFVTKINAAGSARVYSTYLGGSGAGQEKANDIAADEDGNAYVTGVTAAGDFPTQNPFQGTFGGDHDAFVTKLSPDGSELVFSTCLGGTGYDEAHGIALNENRDVHVAGETTSSADFPTQAPFQPAYGGGAGDAFVTKFASTGGSLEYSSYLGGSDSDFASDIAVGRTLGRAYVTGNTFSTNFPTQNPTQVANAGAGDAFVTQLDAAGAAPLFSTYLGGSGADTSNAVAVSTAGLISVAGLTASTNFPTQSPLQPASGGGTTDAFVSRLFPFSVFTVTNTNDSGAGSLRAAITAANAAAGPDLITFNIPGAGPHTISPLTQLPAVTGDLVIDGYTQPGSSVNTLEVGNNAVLKIVLSGNSAGAGTHGLVVNGSSVVRGLVVNQFDNAGVRVNTTSGLGVRVVGNFIGTDAAGAVDLGNGIGVEEMASGTSVGDGTVAGRNLISGNTVAGVRLAGGSSSVQGCYIGTDAQGTAALPNGTTAASGWGVLVNSSFNNILGGPAAARNVISGNTSSGVRVAGPGALNNSIRGNYIGVAANGGADLGNGLHGVELNNAPNTFIGGDAPDGNVIAGNADRGVSVENGSNTATLVGNYVGLAADGNTAVANAGDGVHVTQSANCRVGLNTPNGRNLIAGNGGDGVQITGAAATGNRVEGNYFGTNSGAEADRPNVGFNLLVSTGASNNTVGGINAGAANLFRSTSVLIDSGTGNAVLSNRFFAPTLIDLGDGSGAGNGITPNDAGDPDTGANNLQNFPVLTSAQLFGDGTNIQGTLNSTASTTFRLEFFASPACGGGNGPGETFIGAAYVTTDGSGNAAFSTTLPVAVPAGNVVTATATNPSNNTSEFSACRTVALTPPCGSASFAAAANFAAAAGATDPKAVAVGDFNGDGRQDIVAANNGSSNVSLFPGNGAGGLGAATNFAVGNNPRGIVAADFDNDGDLDAATANNDGSISVLRGNGAGSFAAAANVALGGSLSALAALDFTDDGFLDLVATDDNDGVAVLLLNDGLGGFSDVDSLIAGDDPSAVAAADLNNDNRPDFVVANFTSNDVTVLLNDGAGSFTSGNNLPVGTGPRGVVLRDLTNTGRPDIITANNDGTVSVRLNDGLGAFGNVTNFPAGTSLTGLVAADLDGDGDPDIAAADSSADAARVLLGDASGTLNLFTSAAVGDQPAAVAVADFNGDGKPDLATANTGTADNVSVLLNSCVPPAAQTYTVNSTDDTADGACAPVGTGNGCTLREAITLSNESVGLADTVAFNIAGAGVHTINVTGGLPEITDPVTIDGATQPGYVAGTPLIELNGAAADPGASGLYITAGNTTVRALVINRFGTAGAVEPGGQGILIETLGGNVVEGCFIGTDAAGAAAQGNRTNGIQIVNSAGNQIGGTTVAQRNVVSGNGNLGILLSGAASDNNVIRGNYVGTDKNGTADLGNANTGISLGTGGGSGNQIGGTAAGAGNVVSGNAANGINVVGAGANNNVVQGNFVGTAANGVSALGNTGHGIQVSSSASNNQIGGTAAGAGNRIAFNTADGVLLFNGTGNSVLGNSIHSNGATAADLGIDLGNSGVAPNDAGDPDTGTNNLQNFPLLESAVTTAGNTLVNGTLNSTASTQFRVEFFSSPACDASGNGEGRTFLGSADVTTDAEGNAVISTMLNAVSVTGQAVTATATDPSNNTSEFSPCVTGMGTPATTVAWLNAAGGNWNNAANWQDGTGTNRVPGAGDDVFITAGATYAVTLDVAASVNSLTVGAPGGTQTFNQNGFALTLASASTVNANGVFNQAGTLSGAGAVSVNGVFNLTGTVAGTGALNVGAAGTLNIGGTQPVISRTVNNSGTANYAPTSSTVFTGGTFNNLSGANFNLNSEAQLFQSGGTNAFNNAGTVTKSSGAGELAFNLPFTNNGTVNLQSGIINFGTSVGGTGAFNGAGSTAFQFTNATLNTGSSVTASFVNFNGTNTVRATYNVGDTTTVNGTADFTGTVTSVGATLTVTGRADFNSNAVTVATINLNGGAVGGSAAFGPTATGTFNFNGRLDGTGTTNIPAGATLNLGGVQPVLSRTINNSGTAVYQPTSSMVFTGGTFNNLSGATFEIRNASPLFQSGGTNLFQNNGTLRRTTAAGTTPVNVPFNNNGAVELQTGALHFGNDGTSTGSFTGAAGTALTLLGQTLQPASSVAAPTVTLGGITTVAGTYNVSNTTTIVGDITFTGTVTSVGTSLNLPGRADFNSNAVTVQTTTVTGALGGSANFNVGAGGTLNFRGTMDGAGVTNVPAGATLNIDGAQPVLSRTLNNSGAANYAVAGSFLFTGGTFNNLAGATFNAAVEFQLFQSGGTNAFNNAGTLAKTAGAGTLNFNVPLTNTGTVNAQSGTLSFGNGFTQTAGETFLNGGNVASSATFALQGGTLRGAGTFTGNVNNSGGMVAPGASPGCMAIAGDYAQGPAGTLASEIGGTTACSQYDQLNVIGTATLDGTLAATFVNGFSPSPGDSFRVLTYNSRAGTFSNVTGGLMPAYNANDLTLSAAPPSALITVTNTNDAGAGSLRQAILASNAQAGLDTIQFNIPNAGPHTISPASALPAITDPVVIDGYTQPGSSANTLAAGNDAVILVELDGTGAGAGANGLVITAGSSVVRGLAVLDFDGAGLLLQTGDGNTIEGNFIGLNAAGTAAPGTGNVNGVVIESGSANNLVGGAAVAARNVISANDAPSAGFVKNGILIRGAGTDGNAVRNNYVGTNPAGSAALPNGNIGVFITDGPKSTRVGGEGAADRNVISGNQTSGVVISGAGTDENIVGANYIGLNAAGTAGIGAEQETGVGITNGAKNNTVGGATPGERNVISGTGFGVSITNAGTTGNRVRGNFIGTDAAGAATVANSQTGVAVSFDATGNTVGGTSAADRNVISGNAIGVFLSGSASGNAVQGNFIGTDPSGAAALPNTGVGVFAGFGASNNTIGGTAAGAGNRIAFNGADGVSFGAATGNAVLSNSIHSNGATAGDLGIDLDPDGVTPNDAGDPDTGANNLQNFPVLTSAVANANNTTVTGTLNSTPSTQFRVEFFSNATCDASGNGEGRTLRRALNFTTDAAGNADISNNLLLPVTPGEFITATATDPAGNTSEFSPCRVAPPPGAGTVQFDASAAVVNESAGTIQLTVTRTGGSSGAVTVAYTDTPGTAANPADYSNATGTVIFADGDAAPKTFNVTINNDALDENDETFSVALSVVNGSAVVGTPATHTVTIADDDDPAADLSVTVGDSPDPVTVGDTLTYVFTVTNTGPDTASGVTFIDALPPGLLLISATPSQGTCFGTMNVTCNLSTLLTGGAATVTILVGPTSPGTLVNTGSVSATQTDPDATNNSATATTTVNNVPVVFIAGRVADANGQGVLGVNVTLSGTQSAVTTTDAAGNYAFNNLTAGGSYTVTPSEVNYVFAPASRAFNNLAANATADFTASLVNVSVTGRVTDAGGDGLAGVTLTVSGALSLVTETDSSGNYSIRNVPANASFTITPDLTGYSFAPESRAFAAVTTNQTGADFTGTLQPQPTPTPDPGDDFSSPQRDPVKWNVGILTQEPSGFDPVVLLNQPDGRLEITPRTEANGRSFNGYVSRIALDLSFTPVVSIEAIQPATGPGVQTIFGLGKDKENFFRFLVEDSPASPFAPRQEGAANAGRAEAMPTPTPAPQTLSFQSVFNGVKLAASVDYNAQQHRHWRFRYDAPAQKVHLETSPDRVVWTTQLTADLGRDQTRLIAELSAGSFGPLQFPTVALFDNYIVSAPTRLQFSSPGFNAPENSGAVTVTVTRSGETGSPSTVAYASSAGTAADGADYRNVSGTLRFEAGETSKTFTLPLLDDDAAEGPETVNLSLSNVVGGTLGANATAVLTISDDDNSSANPIDDSTVFVTAHYSDFLNREPDEAGLAFWVNGIESCGADAQCREVKRIDTSAAFFLSIEFQRTGFVAYRFYDAAFDRFPDFDEEFLPDAQALGEGVVVGRPGFEQRLQRNKRAFAAEFVRRPAFRARYDALNSADYVDALYRNAGVRPAPDERVALIAELVTGRTTRADVLITVVEDEEFIRRELNRAFVLMQYFGYLRRNPDDPPDTNFDGYDFWLAKLEQFGGNYVEAEMVKAFISSIEYRRRFGRP